MCWAFKGMCFDLQPIWLWKKRDPPCIPVHWPGCKGGRFAGSPCALPARGSHDEAFCCVAAGGLHACMGLLAGKLKSSGAWLLRSLAPQLPRSLAP